MSSNQTNELILKNCNPKEVRKKHQMFKEVAWKLQLIRLEKESC